MKIIDRKKHIFKLAQGEYVAPEKIENVYCEETMVAQVYVHGESLKVNLTQIKSSWTLKHETYVGYSNTISQL